MRSLDQDAWPVLAAFLVGTALPTYFAGVDTATMAGALVLAWLGAYLLLTKAAPRLVRLKRWADASVAGAALLAFALAAACSTTALLAALLLG